MLLPRSSPLLSALIILLLLNITNATKSEDSLNKRYEEDEKLSTHFSPYNNKNKKYRKKSRKGSKSSNYYNDDYNPENKYEHQYGNKHSSYDGKNNYYDDYEKSKGYPSYKNHKS
ncbi:1211_t:CDS:1, partial [Gigaspora rosea]